MGGCVMELAPFLPQCLAYGGQTTRCQKIMCGIMPSSNWQNRSERISAFAISGSNLDRMMAWKQLSQSHWCG
jgi:hypothetical protein